MRRAKLAAPTVKNLLSAMGAQSAGQLSKDARKSRVMRNIAARITKGRPVTRSTLGRVAKYAASKAGVIAFTQSVAKELAKRNITVNAIAPGIIKTQMTEKLGEQILETFKQHIPLGRFGEPKDVAEVALFLASDEASYITGQVIRVDGGTNM